MINFKIKVAGKIIQFRSDDSRLSYNASENRDFKHFVGSAETEPDLIFDIKYGSIPEFRNKKRLFVVDRGWVLSECGNKMLFEYPDRSLEGRMERVGEINEDMTKGTIYVNRDKTSEEREEAERQKNLAMTEEEKIKRETNKKKRMERCAMRRRSQPKKLNEPNKPKQAKKPKEKTPEQIGRGVISGIKQNFFQAFLVNYVIEKNLGFLAHTSSVQHDNGLYLFMGPQEAGKSTIAEFWHTKTGAKVFNDDRAVITSKNGKSYFFNAPWAGTLQDKCDLGKGDGTEIDGILFISHAGKNVLRKLNATQAVSRIFRNSFPAFWNRAALAYMLELCAKIAQTVPCYDLGFVNNDSVVTFLRKEMK